MEINRITELLKSFQKMHILVIGDVMLDEFIWGKVSRISPEAPVPVVEVTSETAYPGGAANVARNLKEFCMETSVMGMVGKDLHGKQLTEIMRALDLNLEGLFEEEGYQTIVKTRIVARQQQMVRVDREVLTAPGASLIERALVRLEQILPEVDGVIFEDYAKGLLSQEFVTKATEMIVQKGKILTADPNPKNPLVWNGLTAIKPNRSEAFRCAGVEENDPDNDFITTSRLPLVSQRLLEKWNSQYLLITLGEHGMVLFERDSEPYHIPTRAQEVYDVSGAGDTAIALFTLALAAGATPRESAEISNHASSIVVGKLGTATLTPAELLASFERHDNAC